MNPQIWKIIKGPNANALPVILIDETKTHYMFLTELLPPIGAPRTEPRVRIAGVEKAEARAWYEPAPNEPTSVIAKIYQHHAAELGASIDAIEAIEAILGAKSPSRQKAVEIGQRDSAPFDGAKAVNSTKPSTVLEVVKKASGAPAMPSTIKKPAASWGAPEPKSVAPKAKYGW